MESVAMACPSLALTPTGIAAANPGIQNLIMALVFPVGLLILQLCGAELYTGNTAFVSGHAVVVTSGLSESLRLMNEGFLQNQLLMPLVMVQGFPLLAHHAAAWQNMCIAPAAHPHEGRKHMYVLCAHTCLAQLCHVGSNVGGGCAALECQIRASRALADFPPCSTPLNSRSQPPCWRARQRWGNL